MNDLTSGELDAVKRQLKRIKALGDGKITVTFEKHTLVGIGIFAEIDVNFSPSLDNPGGAELRD